MYTQTNFCRQKHCLSQVYIHPQLSLVSGSLCVVTGWSIVLFSFLHTFAHWNNFARLARANNLGFVGWLEANFLTGPGWTGYIMLICLCLMAFTAVDRFKKANFERFWYTHHLFVVFFLFWSFHGAFCMIKPDRPPFCNSIGVFWKFWVAGGMIYLVERTLREVRGRHKTFISKVIEHPSNVVEIQIKKEHTTTRAGQYIFLCCPEVSIWQYHPFTLTSAPEEDYISVHIRMTGNFTKALGKTLGCNIDKKDDKETMAKKARRESRIIGIDKDTKEDCDPAIRRVLPRRKLNTRYVTVCTILTLVQSTLTVLSAVHPKMSSSMKLPCS